MFGNKDIKDQFTLKWQLKFIAMILFTACLFLMKIITGHITNSMALVADSFHMVTDFAALTVGYIALRLANSKTGSLKFADRDKFTFGWVRAEVLGGMINTVFLLALCFSVLVTALKRFVQPEIITEPKPVLVVGIVSLIVNFLGLLLFRTSRENLWKLCGKFCYQPKQKEIPEEISLMSYEKEEKNNDGVRKRKNKNHATLNNQDPTWETEYQTPHSLNIRGVYLHILEHFLASIIVIISAVIVIFNEGEHWTAYIDPAFTLLVVFTILYSTVPLFRETLILFMQSVPANIKVKDLEERLIKHVPQVLAVHEFHIWQLGGGDQVVASAHILFREPEDFKKSVNKIKTFFRREGIGNLTFQPEFLPTDADSNIPDNINPIFSPSKCYFRCADVKDCSPLTCCAVYDDGEDTSTTETTDVISCSPDVKSIVSCETGI